MKKCYLVGAGVMSEGFSPDKDDFVIAADGGYAHLCRLGIRTDLFVGDGDSLGRFPDGVECVRHEVKKDYTDMHLSYLEGKKRGYTTFEIYGGTGGRIDHTLANISLLLYAKEKGDNVTLCFDGWRAFIIMNESVALSGARGNHLSLFAYGGDAVGVSIRGAEYEADNITLKPDFALGVSNSFTDGQVNVSVSRGALLIVYGV